MTNAAPRGWIVSLALIVAIGPLSIDMYLPTLPLLQDHFGVDAAAAQLTLSAYFIGLALGQIVYGPLTDRYGRRRPLLFGLSLYSVASVLCAFAPDIGWLTAGRFLQAIGACVGMVATRAMVRDQYTTDEMARILSSLLLVMGLAPILAPLLGGQLLALAGWQAIFVVLAVFGAGCVLLTWRGLPETLRTPLATLQPSAIAALYLRLLRHRRFMGYALAGGVASAGMFAYISDAPFVFIEVYGVSPQAFGLFFGANALGLIAASQLNRQLLRRYRAEFLLRIALRVFALSGCVTWAMAVLGWGGLWGVALPLWLSISALGCSFPNASAAAMEPFGDRAGMAAALMGTLQFAVAAVAGAAVGQLHDGSARPMAAVVAACGVTAVLLLRGLVRSREAPARR